MKAKKTITEEQIQALLRLFEAYDNGTVLSTDNYNKIVDLMYELEYE